MPAVAPLLAENGTICRNIASRPRKTSSRVCAQGMTTTTVGYGDLLPTLEQVLFVECGVGCDQHGQNMTKAVLRACRNAIEFNSIPCIQQIVPNGYNGLVVTAKIGCPRPAEVDLRAVKDVFPYGKVFCRAVEGGLSAPSGIQIRSMGDTEDALLIAVVAVTVGYGLRPEDLIDV